MPFDFFGGVDYLSSLLTSFAFVNAACLSSRGAFAKSWSSINAATPRRTPPPRHRKACGLSPFPAGSASPSAVKKAASCERREASLTPCTNTLSPSSCATNAKSRLRGNAKHEMGGGLFKLTVVQGAPHAAGTYYTALGRASFLVSRPGARRSTVMGNRKQDCLPARLLGKPRLILSVQILLLPVEVATD